MATAHRLAQRGYGVIDRKLEAVVRLGEVGEIRRLHQLRYPFRLRISAGYFFFSCMRLTIFVAIPRGDTRNPCTSAAFFHPGITSRLPRFIPS